MFWIICSERISLVGETIWWIYPTDTLSPTIVEVENYPKWKETTTGGTQQICSILSTVCGFSCLGSCLLCQRSGFWWFFFLFITWFLVILAKLLWNQSVQNIPNCQFRRPWERYSHKSVIDVKCHSVILSFPFWNTILLKGLTYIWAESFAIKTVP